MSQNMNTQSFSCPHIKINHINRKALQRAINYILVLKSISPNSCYGQSKKGPQNSKKSFVASLDSSWYLN